MRNKWIALFILALVMAVFSSCQKEISGEGILPDPSDNPLLGTWKLIDNNVQSSVSQELTDDIGTISNISTFDYITTNNKGSLTFELDKMLGKQLSFDVAGTINSEIYVNGFFVESFETPVSGSAPPSTTSNPYVLIGTDSIYCENGSFLEIEGADSSVTVPTGFRFTITDNRLVLTNHTVTSEESTEEGITTKTDSEITVVTTLEKQ